MSQYNTMTFYSNLYWKLIEHVFIYLVNDKESNIDSIRLDKKILRKVK
jgi:hypothetical protein